MSSRLPVQVAGVDIEVDLEALFPCTSQAQRDFIYGSSRPYQLWVAGRGNGKSWGLTAAAIFLALVNGGRGGDIRILLLGRIDDECTEKLAPYIDEHLARFRELTGVPLLASYSSGDRCYTLTNGVRIFMRPYGQPRTLKQIRGWTVTAVLADEIAHADIDSNDLLKTASYCIRDSTAPERRFAATTSPRGRRGLVKTFLDKWDQKDPAYAVFSSSIYDCSHITEADIAERRSGSTPESWAEEALGYILAPTSVIYTQFSPTESVCTWTRDPHAYWGVGVDWGTNNAWVGAAEIRHDGTWVWFRTRKCVGVSRIEFRRIVRDFHDEIASEYGRPADIWGADRAIGSENNWLRGSFEAGARFGVHTCEKKDEQKRALGIALTQFMLRPLEGPRRMFFADHLPAGLSEDAMDLRDAVASYEYVSRRIRGELVVTDSPEENTPPTHPCDGERYLVTVSRHIAELHGGQPLPDLIDKDVLGRGRPPQEDDLLRSSP